MAARISAPAAINPIITQMGGLTSRVKRNGRYNVPSSATSTLPVMDVSALGVKTIRPSYVRGEGGQL